MDERMFDLENRWERKEESILEKTVEKVISGMEEKKEEEKRRNNVVMYNIPESGEETGIQREKEDDFRCKRIFEVDIEVRDVEIVKTIRLGRKIDGKMRPVLENF